MQVTLANTALNREFCNQRCASRLRSKPGHSRTDRYILRINDVGRAVDRLRKLADSKGNIEKKITSSRENEQWQVWTKKNEQTILGLAGGR